MMCPVSRRERWVIHGLLAAAVLLVVVSVGMTIGRDLYRSFAPPADVRTATSADAVRVANTSLPPLPELGLPPAVIPAPPLGTPPTVARSPEQPQSARNEPAQESPVIKPALTSSVKGLWKISVPTEGYMHRPSVLLEHKGKEITGTYTADNSRKTKVEHAKLSGDTLSFHVTHEQLGKEMKCQFVGTVKGDTWSGRVDYDLGGSKGYLSFEAHRETGRVVEKATSGAAKAATTPSQQAGSGLRKPTETAAAKPPAGTGNKKVDPFPAGSMWVDDDASRTLTVLERMGETFRGKLVVEGALERTFTGIVKDGKVSWLARDVEAAKGGRGGDNTGTIQGDRIDFEYRTDSGKGKFTLWRKNAKAESLSPAQRQMAKASSKKKAESSRKNSAPAASPAAAVVTVDFHKPVKNVKSMSGFLGSMDHENPPDERILPLRPALMRSFMGSYKPKGDMTKLPKFFKARGTLDRLTIERLARMKHATIATPGTAWKYSQARGDWHWPYEDYEHWENTVREVAHDYKEFNLIWDICNEPDSRMFWKGSRQQFCETFVRAAKVLRQELGSRAVISGPCLAQYDPVFIKEFLDYCAARDVSLSVLSWHEFVDDNIPSVTEHLRDARRQFLQNPAYAGLGIKKIHINEIVGPASQYLPGEILGYLHALEAGGADAACKSCWKDSKGGENGLNNTLDGILTPSKYEPRAAWWAYKHYADSVATRVQSTSSDIRIASFASRGADDDKESARVLIGYYAYQNSPNVMAARLRFQGLKAIKSLAKAKKVRVRIEQIPNSGERPVGKLKTVAEDTLSVVSGAAETRPFNLVLHEAYVVKLLDE